MTDAVREEIEAALDELPEEGLKALLEMLRRMKAREPGGWWSPAIGSMPDDDAEEMRRIIEEGCERIETNSW
jgi:hypothetical protein